MLLKQENKETLKIEKSLLIFMAILFAALSYNSRENNSLYSFAESSVPDYCEVVVVVCSTQERVRARG